MGRTYVRTYVRTYICSKATPQARPYVTCLWLSRLLVGRFLVQSHPLAGPSTFKGSSAGDDDSLTTAKCMPVLHRANVLFLRTYFLTLPYSNLRGWWISALRDTYVSLRFVVAIRYVMRHEIRTYVCLTNPPQGGPGGCQPSGMRCGRRSLAALRPPPWYTHVRIVTHVPKITSTYSRL